jgi:hypothetical protein
MVDRSKNRSSGYQHVLVESPTSPEMLAEVADTDGIMALMSNGAYNEELLELKEQLRKAFWRLVDTKLTDRQKEVVHLYAQGLTQTEGIDYNQTFSPVVRVNSIRILLTIAAT